MRKIVLAFVLAALSGCGGGIAVDEPATGTKRYLLRLDRAWDRSFGETPHLTEPATNGLPLLDDTHYVPQPPRDAWEITDAGDSLTMKGLSGPYAGRTVTATRQTLRRGGASPPTPGERRFDLQDVGAMDLALRGDQAEITTYGNAHPVLASERGRLIPR
jgi:hypothetical protein